MAFNVVVRTLQHGNLELSVPEQATINSLKERVQEVTSVPADSQRILYRGRELRDNNASLSSLGIPSDAVLHMISSARPRPPRPNSPQFPQGFTIPLGMAVTAQVETGGSAAPEGDAVAAGLGEEMARNAANAPGPDAADANAASAPGTLPRPSPQGGMAGARVLGPFSIPINIEGVRDGDDADMNQVALSVVQQMVQAGVLPGGGGGGPATVSVGRRAQPQPPGGIRPVNQEGRGSNIVNPMPAVYESERGNNVPPRLNSRGELQGPLGIELLEDMLSRIENENMEEDPGPAISVVTAEDMDAHATAWAQAALRFLRASRSILEEAELSRPTLAAVNRIFEEAGIGRIDREFVPESFPICVDSNEDDDAIHVDHGSRDNTTRRTESVGVRPRGGRRAGNVDGLRSGPHSNQNQPSGTSSLGSQSVETTQWFRSASTDDLLLISAVALGEIGRRTMMAMGAIEPMHGTNALMLRTIQRLRSLSTLQGVNRRELSLQIKLVSGHLVRLASALAELGRYFRYLSPAMDNENYFLFGLRSGFLTMIDQLVHPHRLLMGGLPQQNTTRRQRIGHVRLHRQPRRADPNASAPDSNRSNLREVNNLPASGLMGMGVMMMSMNGEDADSPGAVHVGIHNFNPAGGVREEESAPSAGLPQGQPSERPSETHEFTSTRPSQIPIDGEQLRQFLENGLPQILNELPQQIAAAVGAISESNIDLPAISREVSSAVTEALRNAQSSSAPASEARAETDTRTQPSQQEAIQAGLNAAGSVIRRHMEEMLQTEDIARPLETIRSSFGVDLTGGMLNSVQEASGAREARHREGGGAPGSGSDGYLHPSANEAPSNRTAQETNQQTNHPSVPDQAASRRGDRTISASAPNERNLNASVEGPSTVSGMPDSDIVGDARELDGSNSESNGKQERSDREARPSESVQRKKSGHGPLGLGSGKLPSARSNVHRQTPSLQPPHEAPDSAARDNARCSGNKEELEGQKLASSSVQNRSPAAAGGGGGGGGQPKASASCTRGSRPALPPRRQRLSGGDSAASIPSQSRSSQEPMNARSVSAPTGMSGLMNVAGPLLSQVMGGSASGSGDMGSSLAAMLGGSSNLSGRRQPPRSEHFDRDEILTRALSSTDAERWRMRLQRDADARRRRNVERSENPTDAESLEDEKDVECNVNNLSDAYLAACAGRSTKEGLLGNLSGLFGDD